MVQSRLLRSVAVAAVAAAISLVGVTSASAAAPAPPKPTPSCKVPILSVSSTTAMPGSKITVSGKNFSGCSAQGNPAKPTAILTVEVGVLTAAKVKEVLATTKTTATGSFSVQVTVPSVSAGGEPKIALAAESVDSVTKLAYSGFATVLYSKPAPTSASPTPSTSPAPSTSSATPAPTSSSSVDVPTAVPAGTGGLGAPTGTGVLVAELGLGAAGVALVAVGGFGAVRRRARQH